jgi:DNA replication ATP-dependent helicase Dna2
MDTLQLRLNGDLTQLLNAELVLDQSYLDLESFFLDAIDDLERTALGRERILPLLSGQLSPTGALGEFEDTAEALGARGMNDSQAEAGALAAATDLCHLVQGPPGTGKTSVLAQVVKERFARGERILICAATHRAILNALAAVQRAAPEITPLARIGEPIHFDEAAIEQRDAFSELSFASAGGAYVIGATPFATRTFRLRNVDFDTVIFDEASQVTVPLAIMGMLAGRTYLFFGDDQQLPPVLHSVARRDATRCSIFGRLKDRGYDTLLRITYRMNAELTVWPSENFYSGELEASEQSRLRRIAYPQPGGRFAAVLDPECPFALISRPENTDRKTSCEEAVLVTDLVEELLNRGLAATDIGVVVPFRRQARFIRQLLRARTALRFRDAEGCVVDTVERMQGQERECIIFSLTASQPDFVDQIRDFLYHPQRLNVSVTRARSKLIVIASGSLFSTSRLDSDFAEDLMLLQSLRTHCTEIPVANSQQP